MVCPDYLPEPTGLYPWALTNPCIFWGRAGCIVNWETCKWEGRPPIPLVNLPKQQNSDYQTRF